MDSRMRIFSLKFPKGYLEWQALEAQSTQDLKWSDKDEDNSQNVNNCTIIVVKTNHMVRAF